ncbi:MAG: hypothetical protein GEU98_15720 [Pseudonocardiaceae bacterium]|nr:hypothetical protein [Pseudonocardiaceae bacterium]
MPVNDPVMAVLDKLPWQAHRTRPPDCAGAAQNGPVPFGLRFAVTPVIPCDKHKKTYYTVTVKEATQISRDGKTETVQDDVERERED